MSGPKGKDSGKSSESDTKGFVDRYFDLLRDLDKTYSVEQAAKDTGVSKREAEKAWGDAAKQSGN
jgi:molybdenum-dependent DNA-binding transcriptional regulator ModE